MFSLRPIHPEAWWVWHVSCPHEIVSQMADTGNLNVGGPATDPKVQGDYEGNGIRNALITQTEVLPHQYCHGE